MPQEVHVEYICDTTFHVTRDTGSDADIMLTVIAFVIRKRET